MTRLAPLHLGSFIMGAWFYMTAVGNFVAGKSCEATGGHGGEMSKEKLLEIYEMFGWISIGAAVVVLLLSRVVKGWMHLDTLEDHDPGDDLAGQKQAGIEAQEAGSKFTSTLVLAALLSGCVLCGDRKSTRLNSSHT